MKAFFLSVKNWFITHAPTRRRLIQVYAALLYNANLKGYISGQIYTGSSKYACVPGMNCYSCPGAVAACPLGALQNSLASSDKRPAYFMLGILGLFGLMFARTICGFLCPVGLGQDLLYKIKSPKVRKNRFTRILSYLKYVLLVVLVIAIPVIYSIQGNGGTPGFCKTICPAGTFGGGLGLLLHPNNGALLPQLGPIFTWKFCVMVTVIVAAVFLYRPFCRFLCPLGAIYGFFNRIALIGVKLDDSKCTDCGLCVAHCKMDVKKVGDHECINCGECMSVCPAKAITWKGSKIFLKGNEIKTSETIKEQVDIRTMRLDFATDPPAPVLAAAGAPNMNDTTVIKGNVRAIESEATAPSSNRGGSDNDSEHKEIKRGRSFWLRFAAWATALAVLAVSLIYFNFIDVVKIKTGSSEGMKLPSINVTIDDKSEKLSDLYGEISTVIMLLKGSDEDVAILKEAQNSFDSFKESYSVISERMKLLAIIPNSVDKTFVEQNGLDEGDIKIVSATEKDISVFAEKNTEITYPSVLVLNSSGIVTKRDNALKTEKISELIQNANVGPEVGLFAPNFTIRLYGRNENGAYVRLEETFNPYDHLGNVMVINFWATWCGPCVAEIPDFNRVANDYPEITVLAIHGDNFEKESERKYRNIAKYITDPVEGSKESWSEYKIQFAQDNIENSTCLTYNLFGGARYATWPLTFIIGKDGIITFMRIGSIKYETLKSEVQKALEA